MIPGSKGQSITPQQAGGVSIFQRSKLRGIWSSLRSVLIMRHQRYAPLAAFAKCSCQQRHKVNLVDLAHCSRESIRCKRSLQEDF